MLFPKSFTEELLYSTVKIETEHGSGTGFFFAMDVGYGYKTVLLITNKHVINDAEKVIFCMHLSKEDDRENPSGKFDWIEIPAFRDDLLMHPEDETDLCAIMWTPIEHYLNENGFFPYYKSVSQNYVPDSTFLNNLNAVEDILMVGYPIGLWDEVNNFPIIRRGITATHPGVNFRGNKRGVVDIACFAGSSGSPIFLYNEGTYVDKTTKSIKLGGRAYLLGILFAGPVFKSNGEIVVREIPTYRKSVAEYDSMIHLGYYIKIEEVNIFKKLVIKKYEKIAPLPTQTNP